MFNAIIEWWVWLKETFRALFLPPLPDADVVWIGETGVARHR